MNAGRNYKQAIRTTIKVVRCSYVKKSDYLLETPVRHMVLVPVRGAVKIYMVGTISRKLMYKIMLNVKEISPKMGNYLAGFADGEGSFMIVIRNRKDYKLNWKLSLAFNVSQKESYILALFKKHLKCGTLRKRSDGVSYYEVNNISSIIENVIPFFKEFNFLSQNKQKQFSLFVQAAKLFGEKKHLTKSGFDVILQIRRKMNRGGKRTNFI